MFAVKQFEQSNNFCSYNNNWLWEGGAIYEKGVASGMISGSCHIRFTVGSKIHRNKKRIDSVTGANAWINWIYFG